MPRLVGSDHSHIGLVQVDVQQQLVTARSLIIRLDREIVADPALNAEVVLIDVSAAKVRILGAEADQSAGGRARTLFAKVRNQRNVLVEADCPRKLSGLRDAGGLIGRQAVGRVQPHVGGNVVEHVVVAHAESGANHRVVVAEQRARKTRRVCQADHGREIVLVRVHSAVGQSEGRLCRESETRARSSSDRLLAPGWCPATRARRPE